MHLPQEETHVFSALSLSRSHSMGILAVTSSDESLSVHQRLVGVVVKTFHPSETRGAFLAVKHGFFTWAPCVGRTHTHTMSQKLGGTIHLPLCILSASTGTQRGRFGVLGVANRLIEEKKNKRVDLHVCVPCTQIVRCTYAPRV